MKHSRAPTHLTHGATVLAYRRRMTMVRHISVISRLTLLLLSFLLLPVSARADALDYWLGHVVINVTNFYGPMLKGVTYGNGRFMAVGQYSGDPGCAAISDDGVNWALYAPGASYFRDAYDVTFGNNTFVAVGWSFSTPNIYASSSGTMWSQISTAVANVLRVTYGGGRFVAVSDGQLLSGGSFGGTTVSNIYSSPDGYTWTAQNSGVPTNNISVPNDVAYGNNIFAAVAGKYVHLSANGSYWIRRTNTISGNRISFCNDRFIISAGAGSNLVSSDGLNWSLLTNNTGWAFGRVVYGDGNYVTYSYLSSKIFTSIDATNWIERPTQFPTNTYLSALTFGNHKFVAIGNAAVPMAFVSDLAMPTINLTLSPGLLPTLSLTGVTGRTYRIEQHTNLLATNWQAVATFTLTNNPFVWQETNANSPRYYRAAVLP
jgi:hypothetical protein